MYKCDGCGKVIVNERDYMCPHCGAVARKKCDHSTHLPDDKYNRINDYKTSNNSANDYRTTASEHKSKTYNYEKAPKTDNNQKFDINDLANIKNAEDVKKIAKKAFIEQDKNGRKKFKPLAIVLIVIFAVNIFSNVMGLVFDGLESSIEGIASQLPDEWVGYDVGEETLTHNFSVPIYLENVDYDKEKDCLSLGFSKALFEYYYTVNEDYETITDNWQSEFSEPQEYFYSDNVELKITVFSQQDVSKADLLEDSYFSAVTLYGEITDTGVLNVYGLYPHIKSLEGEAIFLDIQGIYVYNENAETKEHFEYSIFMPFNFIKIQPDMSIKFFNIYSTETDVVSEEYDLESQYVDEETLNQHIGDITW